MWRILFVSIVICSLMGCGSKRNQGVVSGKVTYKGSPVNGAALLLIPTSGEGKESTIPVTQEGTYRASGVPPGEYKVIVQPANTSSRLPSEKELEHMDPSKREAAKANLQRMQQQQGKPTIPFPDKYKSHLTTDLKLTVGKSDQPQDLVLTD